MPAGGSLGRILGLGFLFGAQDDGAIETTEDLKEGFDGVAAAVDRVGRGTQSLQRFGNAIGALNVAAIGRVNDALGGLADRSGLLQGGDTSLESFGAQASQAFRAATAGMGEFGEAVRRHRGEITGVAFNLGVDVSELTTAVGTIARTGRDLDDYNISVRTLGGLTQTGIINAADFTRTLTELSEGYELGAEGATRLADEVVAIGTAVGAGREALAGMPAALDAIDTAISALPPGVEANVGDMMRSLNILAAGTTRTLGGTFEENLEGAVGMLSQLSEARQDLTRTFSGLSGDFPEFASGLAEAFGSVDEAFEVLMTDPARAAQEMGRLFAGMPEGVQRTRFVQQVLSRFPESMRFMIMSGEAGATALDELSTAAENSEGALRQMVESSSGSARTFDESLGLVEEAFRSRLNRMARQHYPNFERRVIQRQQEGFARLHDTIGGLAAQRGPLNTLDGAMGALTRTMLATRRGGVTGLSIALQEELAVAFPQLSERVGQFLPMIGEMGEGFFDAATNAGPLLLAMTQMQGRIPGLGGAMRLLPFVALAGGAVLLVRHWETIGPMLERASGQFRDFAADLLERVGEIDWDQLGRDVITGILMAFGQAGDVAGSAEMSETARNFAEGFRSLFQAVGTAAIGLAGGMWDRLIEWIFEPDNIMQSVQRGAAAVGVAFGAAMFTPMRGPILRAAMGLFRGLGGFLQSGGGVLLRGGLRGVLTKIPIIGAILSVLFDLPEIIESFQTGGLTAGIQRIFHSVFNALLFGIPDLIGSLFDTDIFGEITDYLFEALNLGRLFRAFEAGDLGTIIQEVLFTAFNLATGGLFGHFREILNRLFGEDIIGEAMGGVFDMLADLWNDVGVPIMEEVMATWEELGLVAEELWAEVIEPIFTELQDLWEDVMVRNVLPIARRVFRQIGRDAQRMWRRFIKPALEAMLTNFVAVFRFMSQNAAAVFRFIAVNGIRSFFMVSRAIRGMRTQWETAREVLRTGIRRVGLTIRNFFLIPFLRVRNSFTNIAEVVETGVGRMKIAFLILARTAIRSMEQLISAIPGGDVLAAPIRAAREALDVQIRTEESQHAARMRQIQEQRTAREAQVSAERQALVNAENEFNASVRNRRTRRERETRESRAGEARAIAGTQRFFDTAVSGVDRVSDALAEVSTERGRQRLRAQRAQELLTEAQPIARQIEAAMAAGTMEQAAGVAAIEALQAAAEAGDRSRVEALQAELAERAVPVEPEVPRARARTRAPRATPRAAGGGEAIDPQRRQRAREEQMEAEERLMQVHISTISAEAARALVRAMGRPGGTERRRRRPTAPELGGETPT